MIPAAAEVATGYDRLHKPLTIIAGAGDRIVSPQQAEKLHRRVGWSRLVQVGGAGHMVHHTALAEVMGAIDLAMAKYG
jgi:pimeloyl-ACP methyl ester carboxylesterase